MVIVVVFIDWLLSNIRQEQVVSRGTDATVQSSSTNIFRTPYFQFQTDDSWREIESGENEKYIYRSFDSKLVTHEITVEVDKGNPVVLGSERVSRVLPVEIIKNRLSHVSPISPHCTELREDKDNRRQQIVEYRQASFQCNPDSSEFLVSIALVGGSEVIQSETDEGTLRSYKISYRDSTFYPTGRSLDNIIDTMLLFK